jgi:hypothetical protein
MQDIIVKFDVFKNRKTFKVNIFYKNYYKWNKIIKILDLFIRYKFLIFRITKYDIKDQKSYIIKHEKT